MDFKAELIKILETETKLSNEELTNLISIPPNPEMGDYAFPCFKLGKSPKEEAEKLKERIKLPQFIAKVQVLGPYLNFFFNKSVLAEKTLSEIYQKKENYGQKEIGKNKTIILDFSSPNIAKPFGIGHLRSTVIGNCLYKVYQTLGYKTIGINHLGDWGTQFGKLIVAYQKWGEKKELENDPIKYLLKLYVLFHQKAEEDESLQDQAREEFKKLEEGNKEALALWNEFKELSLKEFKRIYNILGVKFDSYDGEAFYNNLLEQTVEKIKKEVETKISEGALIIDLKQYNMPPLLLKKSNGSTTYHTRDLAAAFYRLEHYNPEKIIYVVGSEQKLHFQQLYKVLELMNIDTHKFAHVDFGLFKFPEGKMSTRKGNVIFLEEVLDKAIAQVTKIIEEKNPHLKNKNKVAQEVGIGAIIFGDLSNDRIRNVNFDWDKMLSFEGETGPYVQYTQARACSILRKAETEFQQKITDQVNYDNFNLTEELAVIKLLSEFSETLITVIKQNKPHHLANYLIALSQAFNEFYHKCPVISEQKQQMKARLLLVDCVRQVLKNGLNLLGINAPEEM